MLTYSDTKKAQTDIVRKAIQNKCYIQLLTW